MLRFSLPTILACSLAVAPAWSGDALAAGPSKSKSKGSKGKKKKDAVKDPVDEPPKEPVAEPDAPKVPEATPDTGGDAERVGRVYVDADGLGEAGPYIAGESTKNLQDALKAESVTLTDAPAGPELRVKLSLREAGGYQVDYEIVYDGTTIENGTGGFECPLCLESELIEKVGALGKQVAPKLVVPEPEVPDNPDPDPDLNPDPDPDPGPGPELEDNPGKLRGAGKAGIALMVVGAAAAGTGVGLFVRTDTPVQDADGFWTEARSTKTPGIALLASGGAMLVTGVILLAVDRKKAKTRREEAASRAAPEAAFAPWVGPRSGGLGVVGRF